MALDAPDMVWIPKLLGDFIKVAFSAFIGAWAAFKYQQHNQEQRKLDEQFAEGIKAQFIIYTQFNALLVFKKQKLDEYRDDSNRAFNMTPFSIHSEFPELDINALSYILKDGKPALLAEILITEQRFRTLLGTIEERNNYHRQLTKCFAESGYTNPETNVQEIESIVGIALCKSLSDLTDALYRFSDETLKNHLEVFEQLKQHLSHKFKGKNLLRIEISDEIIEAILGPKRKSTEKSSKEKSA